MWIELSFYSSRLLHSVCSRVGHAPSIHPEDLACSASQERPETAARLDKAVLGRQSRFVGSVVNRLIEPIYKFTFVTRITDTLTWIRYYIYYEVGSNLPYPAKNFGLAQQMWQQVQ